MKLNGGDFSDAIEEYWVAANQANEVAENTGKSLRYGDATVAAKNIERLVRGTQGYILQQLAANGKEKKTIASISGIASAEDHTYTLASYQDKTGQMRYLETVSQVSNNIMDEVGSTVTLDQLKDVDMIILGGLSSTNTDQEILDSLPAEMRDKCFYTASGNGATPGATYILTTRSPENFNNIGRILGCLYPEYVDQSDWVAYVFDDIYHIKDGKIGELTDKTMDGVRNWNATGDTATDWTEADVADYNHDAVVAMLDAGMKYLFSLGSKAPETLQPSSYYPAPDPGEDPGDVEFSFADVTKDMWSYEAIQYVAKNSLMTGYSDSDLFGAEDELTRGQAALILCRYYAPDQENSPNTSGKSDVADGEYYTGAVSWAIKTSVMHGDSDADTFRPNDPITRQELCVVFANVAHVMKGADVDSVDWSALNNMPDKGDVAGWAARSVAWCINNKVVNGVDYGEGVRMVCPDLTADRQTMAQIMMNSISRGTI